MCNRFYRTIPFFLLYNTKQIKFVMKKILLSMLFAFATYICHVYMLKYKAMETRKITQLIVFVLLLVVANNIKAQTELDSTYIYQSFFGKDSTTINSYKVITDGASNYTFTVCNKDTITINDHLYYFVEPKHIESEYGYTVVNYADETIYFREDCENGRLYMHVKNDYVEKDLLLCDMSLNVGDVFLLPTTYDLNQSEQEYYEVVVQSVRDEDGKKIIEFGEVWLEELSIDNLIFTEGTFPMMLPDLDYGFSELICQHKDGELTYIVSPNIEDCVLPTYLSINEIDSKENIAVHPTIFSNNETISVSSDSEVKDVEMMDILGRNMNITSSQTDGFSYQIRLNERCNSGMYLIIVETENGIRYEKVVLR